MSEQAVNFSVDAGLLHAFSHVAAKNACNEVELLKGFMADYVQQDERKQQYEAWFKAKVERGLAELDAGMGISQHEASAQMAAFKTSMLKSREDGVL